MAITLNNVGLSSIRLLRPMIEIKKINHNILHNHNFLHYDR